MREAQACRGGESACQNTSLFKHDEVMNDHDNSLVTSDWLRLSSHRELQLSLWTTPFAIAVEGGSRCGNGLSQKQVHFCSHFIDKLVQKKLLVAPGLTRSDRTLVLELSRFRRLAASALHRREKRMVSGPKRYTVTTSKHCYY